MGKSTENQKASKAILSGVVDYDYVAEVAVNIKGMGKMLILNCTYDEFCEKMLVAQSQGLPWIDTETFIWAGSAQQDQHHFRTTIKIDEIVSVEELTQEMWMFHVTTARAAMTNQRMQGIVPRAG